MNSTIWSETSTITRQATKALAQHIGVAESVQSADAEHEDTTAAVATMVLPAKMTVKDIATGSTAGAVDTSR